MKERDYYIQGVCTGALVCATAALTYLSIFPFAVEEYFPFGKSVLVVILAMLFLLSGYGVAHIQGKSIRRLLCTWACIPLTAYIFSFVWNLHHPNAQLLWAIVLWAVCITELVWASVRPLLRANRTLFLVTLAVFTIVWICMSVFVGKQVPVLFSLDVALLWMLFVRFAEDTRDAPKQKMSKTALAVWLGVFAVVFALGAWFRIAEVNHFALQNDEYFHVNTAIGYVHTGEYVRWNTLTDTSGKVYERAWPYTWQVAKSIQLFGEHEWTFRLPALIWGLIILILLPVVVYCFTRSTSAALLATLFVVFDSGFVWSSTYTRMYSLFVVVCCAAFFLFWKTFRRKEQPYWQRWVWFAASVVGIYFSSLVHQSGLILFVGLFVLGALMFLRNPQNRWYRDAFLCMVGVGILAGIVHLIHPFLPTYFITFDKSATDKYLFYPVQNLTVPLLGILLFIAPLVVIPWKQLSTWMVVLYANTIPYLIYFTYFSARYSARKYSMFFFVAVFMIIAWAWQNWLGRFIRQPLLKIGLPILFGVIVLVPLSFPGVPKWFIIDQARADQTYEQLELHDYATAYAELERNVQPGDTVLIFSPKWYYLHRPDVQYVRIPANRQYTVKNIRKIIRRNPNAWIVYPKYKQQHLKLRVRMYVKTCFTLLPGSKKTNVLIYQFSGNDQCVAPASHTQKK